MRRWKELAAALQNEVKELEQALSERDKARADLERLSKESVAHKYTVQSLKDQIS